MQDEHGFPSNARGLNKGEAVVRVGRVVVAGAWLTGAAAVAGFAVAGSQTATAAADVQNTYTITNDSGARVRWSCTGCSSSRHSVASGRGERTNFDAAYPNNPIADPFGEFTPPHKGLLAPVDNRPGYNNPKLTQLDVTATYTLGYYQTATINFTERQVFQPHLWARPGPPKTWSVKITQAAIGAPFVETTGQTSGVSCSDAFASRCSITLQK